MKVKVCGITREEDLKALAEMQVDFVGLILYPGSKRYVGKKLKELAGISHKKLKRVGVFVNEKPETVVRICKENKFDFAQLHGNEPPDYCKTIRESIKVIKAFSIDETFDFGQLKAYDSACDYFLFDAKGRLPGGNSISYNWNILQRYEKEKPFFLSGGISPKHAEQLNAFSHPSFFAIDINSGFETSPGIKDTNLIRTFIQQLKQPA